MREVQASQAKIHLLRLLDEVERGETLVITRHGRRVARLEPERNQQQESARRAAAEIRRLAEANRKRHGPITIEEILSARDEGRKY